jgi:hypothetical protein
LDAKTERSRQNRMRMDPEIRRSYFRDYHKERSSRDPQFRMANAMRNRIRAAILSKGGTKSGGTMALLGCDIATVRAHLESLFAPWMSWSNFGDWHIDHIVPMSAFDLTDPEQQRRACHYTNLQPLSATENMRKSNRR